MSFADPQSNLHMFGLEAGMDVVDLGAGPGHYALAAAQIVGDKGHVCAVEIQKDLVEKVKNEASNAGLKNVDVVWSDLEKDGGSLLDDESVDVVILSNILFQITSKQTLLTEAYRVMRPGGRALVIDWSDSYGGLGPPEDHLVDPESLIALAESCGFSIDRRLNPGAHHWGLTLKKI